MPVKNVVLRLALTVFVAIFFSCEYERIEPITPNDPADPGVPTITFVKNGNTDPSSEENQDRITENVWITRGSGGQIYNARIRNSVDKNESPLDTEWALGTLDQLENLTFDTFRNTIRPRQVIGKDLVLHLITDDIYLNVRFTAWSSGKSGGFAYVRTDIDPVNQ